MSTQPTTHIPVLLNEVVTALQPRKDGVYVDATFGRGGYTRAILNAAPGVRVIAIDRDPEAIKAGQALVAEFASRLSLLQGPFGAMDVLLAGQNVAHVDGVVMDIGVSSPQLDQAERGFSFQSDGPLDMRMSQSGPTAADIVNTLPEEELANIIYHLGEERYSRRVARKIVEGRAQRRIVRTLELAEIVRSAVPRSNDGIDPATRTFQALRLHVNDELGELQRGLAAAEKLLAPNGRLVVVSFHSLEDRIVKNFMRQRSGDMPNASRHLPANDHSQPDPSLEVDGRKPVTATDEESRINPRARSARLRCAIRTKAPAFNASPLAASSLTKDRS